MTGVFADTVYYLAFVNANDELHSRAKQLTLDVTGRLVTTTWVLTEVVDAFSRPACRATVVQLVRDLEADPRVIIVPPTQELFDAGLELFAQRPDKDWSLTDCISFVAMKRHELSDALTADRHFEQAGFHILMH